MGHSELLLVSYDIRYGSRRTYSDVERLLQEEFEGVRILHNVWLLATSWSASAVAEEMRPFVDSIAIVGVSGDEGLDWAFDGVDGPGRAMLDEVSDRFNEEAWNTSRDGDNG